MLHNHEALQLLLNSYAQFSNNDISAIISTRMKILAITDLSANIYLQKKEKLVGKHMFNYFRKDIDLAKRGATLLSKVIQDRRVIEVISINFQRVKGYVVLLAKYTPIINADQAK